MFALVEHYKRIFGDFTDGGKKILLLVGGSFQQKMLLVVKEAMIVIHILCNVTGTAIYAATWVR
jgi:hypothetical protein